ncbi:MAG: MarR family transcriptional regulator [Bacteroidota bacterium]
MSSQPTTDPLDSFVFLTNRVGRLIVKRIREEIDFEKFGLSPFHMGILADLFLEDGVRQQDLAVSSIKDKATIARALERMEQKGFLERIPDPKDKRSKRILLTEKGKELHGKVFSKAMDIEQEVTPSVSLEDLRTTRRVLRQIYEHLQG